MTHTCFIYMGVAMVPQWRHFLFNLPLYFLVPGVFSEIITVQFLIRRGRWIKAPKTCLYRVSLEPWGATVARWWEHSPTTNNVARVQILASTSNVGWVCCWFSHLLREVLGFSMDTQVFPFPQKPTLPNSNSIWNARTRFNEFSWTPKCFVGKQITIYNLQISRKIFTITGEKVPELKFKTIGTVVHRSSSDWNLRIYLPKVLRLALFKRVFSASIQRPRRIQNWTI